MSAVRREKFNLIEPRRRRRRRIVTSRKLKSPPPPTSRKFTGDAVRRSTGGRCVSVDEGGDFSSSVL